MTPEDRLAAAVHSTIARLPADARRALDGQWNWRLVDSLGNKPDGHMVWGEAHYRSLTELIVAVAVARLGEEILLETLVAHELAHLVLFLRDEDDPNDEGRVNDLVRDWGLPMDRLL